MQESLGGESPGGTSSTLLGVRGRARLYSRFDPRPGRPLFGNFGAVSTGRPNMTHEISYISDAVSCVVCPTEVDIALSLPQAQARESGHSSPTNHRRHTACSRARCANCRLAWHKRAWGSTWTADVGEPPPHTWTCCLGQSYRAYRSLYDSPATSRRVLQAQRAPPGVDIHDKLQL